MSAHSMAMMALHPVGDIANLNVNKVLSSTVSANGDNNPYAVTVNMVKGSKFFGQVFVSDFSNKAGVNGAGSTIVRIVNGKPVPFTTTAMGPAAMAFSPLGPLWIANFGKDGTDGNVQVTKPNGASFGSAGTIVNSAVKGPWGQAFAAPYATSSGVKVPPTFFVTGAENGTVAAMYGFSPPHFDTTTKFLVIGSGLPTMGTNANNIQGPQGMAWDAMSHTLYVADTADNAIYAYQWYGANTPNQGKGQLVYQGGALKQPAGLTVDPVNGNLLVVNQGNNHLVQLRVDWSGNKPSAHVVGQVVLDKTPVNPKTGAGSALFGVTATTDSAGNLVVYYTDDNTNTVNELSYQPTYGAWQKKTGGFLYAGGLPISGFPYWTATDSLTHQMKSVVPLYYIQQALKQLGIHSMWNGMALNLTIPGNMTMASSSNMPMSTGSSMAMVQVNGKTVASVPKLVATDWYSGKNTTYVAFNQLQQVMADLHINLQWNGSSLMLTLQKA